MFIVKKIIGTALLPLSIFLLLLLIGILLLRNSRKQHAAKTFITIATIVFILISFKGLPYLLLRPLEFYYPALNVSSSDSLVKKYPDVKWIIVLSSGHFSNPEIPPSSQAARATTIRLVEGISIFRQCPKAKLLLSGGDFFDSTSDAQVMNSIAKQLGVDASRMVLENDSKDTEDQAQLIKPIVGNDQCILVTSASHMFRAMALFRKAGIDPIPAPTDYLVKTVGITPGFFYPNEEALLQSRTAMYEILGILWAKARGKI